MKRSVSPSLIVVVAVSSLFVWSCSDDAPSETNGDGGPDGSPTTCTSNEECDDGVFCNGTETCSPDNPGSDSDGCLDGTPPCPDGETCNEDTQLCATGCDSDGDAHEAIECGGDDCDDDDANRFPGNAETCDVEGHDEDCDPATLGGPGDGDSDGDGFVSTECCNTQDDESLLCGDDCDDSLSGINPGATDDCNGRDDDCDGEIDEEPTLVFYRDVDADNYGVDDETITACSRPDGFSLNSGDCDDTNPAVNPGEPESCDGLDNNCDGSTDEGCGCSPDGSTQECGEPDGSGGFIEEGVCTIGLQTCVSGTWTDCVGSVTASAEVCDDFDNDCDGTTDEGFDCRIGTDVSCTTSCGTTGSGTCTLSCAVPTGSACHPPDETCNGGDDDCDGVADEDYDCAAGSTVSCTTSCGSTGTGTCSASCTLPSTAACAAPAETCNGDDDDCDGTADEGLWCSMASDATDDLRGVWAADADDVFIVGPTDVLYRFNGSTIVEEDLAARFTTLGEVRDIWGIFDNVTIPGEGARDVIDAWTCGTFGVGGGVFYLMNLHTTTGTGTWSTRDYPSGGDCTAVSGQSQLIPPHYSVPFFVVAVPAETGVIWRRNYIEGTGWSRDDSGTTNTLLDIDWLTAVGESGTIVRCSNPYDCTWSTLSSPTTRTLRSVSLPWAVGDGGTIIHEDDGSWITETSGTTRRLRGVATHTTDEAWAVGNNGTILYCNGSSWSSQSSGTTVDLYAVDTTETAVWVAGDGGTILRRVFE